MTEKDPFAVLSDMRDAERADQASGPRFVDCPFPIGGETLRLRRLSLALAAAMTARVLEAKTAEQRAAVDLHLCQISLVPVTSSALRFPGDEGKSALVALLAEDRVTALAAALRQWNVLPEASTAGDGESIDVEDVTA